MKHYLLTFNQDYADEHNVPALACFTEEEYQTWLNTKIVNENPNYKKESVEFDILQEKHEKYRTFIRENNLGIIPFTQWTEEQNAFKRLYDVGWPQAPAKGSSRLSVFLGNSGDCWEEDFECYLYAKEMVEDGTVTVTEVSEEFYKTFNSANLSDLSLCNIFDVESINNNEEEYEEDNED